MVSTPKIIRLDKQILNIKDKITANNEQISAIKEKYLKDVKQVLRFNAQIDTAQKTITAYEALIGGGLRSLVAKNTMRIITKKKLKIEKKMAKAEKKILKLEAKNVIFNFKKEKLQKVRSKELLKELKKRKKK